MARQRVTRAFAELRFAGHRIDSKTRGLHLKKFHGAQIFEHTFRIKPEGLEFETKELVK